MNSYLICTIDVTRVQRVGTHLEGMRTKEAGLRRRFRLLQLAAPVHLLDWPNHKDHRQGSNQRYCRHDGESPVKMPRLLQYKPRERGSYDARQVTNEILEARPASGGFRTRQG